MLKMTFIDTKGMATEVETPADKTILEIAHAGNIDIEGACEGAMACSTCHIIVDAGWFDRLPPPSIDEEDMLDLAFGLTRTSRLGCQVTVTEDLDGLVVRLPSATRNILLG